MINIKILNILFVIFSLILLPIFAPIIEPTAANTIIENLLIFNPFISFLFFIASTSPREINIAKLYALIWFKSCFLVIICIKTNNDPPPTPKPDKKEDMIDIK